MVHRFIRTALPALVWILALVPGGTQNFAFEFRGPDTLLADPVCEAIFVLYPDSLSVQALVGASVTDTVLTILGGVEVGDTLSPGTVVTVEWKATDDLGNDSIFIFTVTVVDGSPPIFSPALPPDVTVTCPNIPFVPSVNVIDNCDPLPVLAFSETNTKASCAGSYTITRHWEAQDDAGNVNSHSQVITVIDITAPVLNGIPPDMTVNCQDIPAPPVIGMDITATDACDASVSISLSTQNAPGGCANSYGIIRTWTASDDCGNSVSSSQTITVVDNLPPVLFGIPADLTVDCGSVPSPPVNGPGGVTAVDNCTSSPGLVRIDADDQDPDPASCGHVNYTITRTWITSDDCGNIYSDTQILTVRDMAEPTPWCPGPDTVIVPLSTCGVTADLVRVDFISDNCAGGGTVILTDTLAILNTSGTPLASGVVDTVTVDLAVNGLPDQFITGNITLEVRLYAADAEEPGEFYRIFAEDGTLLGQTDPVPSQCGNGLTTLAQLTPAQLNAWALDDQIRFVLVPNGSGVEAINQICPNGRVSLTLSFDAEVAPPSAMQVRFRIDNGPLTDIGTPVTLQPGDHDVEIWATDCSGNTGMCTYPLVVLDREAPTMTCPDTLRFPTKPTDCSASVALPFPTMPWDNCGFPTTFDGAVDTLPFVFTTDPNAGVVPAEMTFLFSIASPSGPGDGLVRIHAEGDIAQPGEFFEVYGENNIFLGLTGLASPLQECQSEAVFSLIIPEPLLKAWTADGQVSITLVPNTDVLNYSDFINPCGPLLPNQTDGKSHAWLELSYASVEAAWSVVRTVDNQSMGNGIMKYPSTPPILNLVSGDYRVTYTIEDSDGNTAQCTAPLLVEDRTPPTITCKPGLFRKTNPSGLVNLVLQPGELMATPPKDNCGITQFQVTPNTFACTDAGSNVQVRVVAWDQAGNSDTCTTLVAIQNEELTPSFALDTCGGKLRLIPDTTFTVPTPGQGDYFLYTWTSANGFFSNQASPVIANPKESDSGIYVLTVTGLSGCTSTGSVQIDIGPNGAFRPVVHSNTPVCQGDTIRLHTEWLQAMTYQWTHQQTGQVFETSVPHLEVPGLLMYDGTWTLKVIQSPGCASDHSAPQAITILPVNVLLPDTLTACEGDTLILPGNGVNVASFTWMGPDGSTWIGAAPLVPALPGTWNLLALNPQGCPARDSLRIVLTERPKITALSSSCPTCVSGTEDCQIYPTVFPPDLGGTYLYAWTGPDGLLFSIDSVAALVNVTGDRSGLYTLRVTRVDNTCTSAPATIFIAMDDTPVTPLIQVDAPSPTDPYEICVGETLVLTVPDDPYEGDVRYVWIGPLSQDTTLLPTLTIPGITLNQGGKYRLKVIVDGCISNLSNEITVIVRPIPFPPTITSNSPVCAGDSLVACAAFTAGATYEWIGPLTNQKGPNCLVIPQAASNHTGYYQVRMTVNGCTSPFSEDAFLEVKPLPLAPNVTDNCGGLICADQPGGCLLTLSGGTAGATFGWYDGKTDTLIGNSGPDPFLALDLPGKYTDGTYEVYVIAVHDGCASVPSVIHNVQINTIPSQVADAGPDVAICAGDPLTLCAQAPVIGTGKWTQVGGPPVTIQTPGTGCTGISGATAGAPMVFAWTLSNGACPDYSSDQAQATVSVVVQAAAPSPVELCRAKVAEISAFDPSPNSGTWSQTPGQSGLGVTIQDPGLLTTSVGGLEPGNVYHFTWTVNNGACPPTSTVVKVVDYDDHAYAGADRNDCGYGCLSLPLVADFTELGSGHWTSPDPEVLLDSISETGTLACQLQPGPNMFIWVLNDGACGVTARDTVIVNYEFASQAHMDTLTIPFAGQALIQVLNNDDLYGPVTVTLVSLPLQGTVDMIGPGVFRYVAPANFAGTVVFRYRICSQQCPDVCTEANVVLNIGGEATCDVPTIITPNQDGINDVFAIPCLVRPEDYPFHRLSVFNQWGDEVFSASPYGNDWSGTYGGQVLPPGTYFYVLDLGNGDTPLSGFLLIKY